MARRLTAGGGAWGGGKYFWWIPPESILELTTSFVVVSKLKKHWWVSHEEKNCRYLQYVFYPLPLTKGRELKIRNTPWDLLRFSSCSYRIFKQFPGTRRKAARAGVCLRPKTYFLIWLSRWDLELPLLNISQIFFPLHRSFFIFKAFSVLYISTYILCLECPSTKVIVDHRIIITICMFVQYRAKKVSWDSTSHN